MSTFRDVGFELDYDAVRALQPHPLADLFPDLTLSLIHI